MRFFDRRSLPGHDNPVARIILHGITVRPAVSAAEVRQSGFLPVTNCCRFKAVDGGIGDHRATFLGATQQRLYGFAARHGLACATLNDLAGINFDGDPIPPYDIHPSRLPDADIIRLGLRIGASCRDRGVPGLIYYQTSPIQACVYLSMLSASGLPFWFTTRLIDGA